jgi:sugar phosphate isomerase/epimerase
MSLDRRQFLSALAALGATRLAARLQPATAGRLDRIGVQLYTVRSEMQKDLEGTLDRVAAIGYQEVEFAGYFGRTPDQVRTALSHAGLTAPGAHVGYDDVTGERWPAMVDAAHAIGHEFIICAWIDEPQRRTVADWQRVAERLNAAAAVAKRGGLRFGYHNHNFEFAPVGNSGQIGYDLLLAGTDCALVAMEMDLYWITDGGGDPLAYFAKYPGRFPLVHVKDMLHPPKGPMADAGAGGIDFARIFARATEAGIEHYFVEYDNPPDPFASIAASYRYLRALRF